MRQLAWLNAVPQAPATRSSSRSAAPVRVSLSRLESMQAAGVPPALPPLSPALGPLLAQFMDVGPSLPGSMGPAPLTYSELRAWQELSGEALSPWQLRLLRNLSRAYVAESAAASDAGRPAPWVEAQSSEDRRAAVARQIGDSMRARAQAQQGRRKGLQ